MKSSRCPICSSAETREHSVHSDRRKGLSGEWQYLECCKCGVIFIDPIPTDSILNSYYSVYYRDENIQTVTTDGKLGTRFPRARGIYHCLSGDVDPRDFIRARRGMRMLDFGSGGGTYLRSFQEQGVNVFGAEVSDVMIAKCMAEGLNVRKIHDFRHIPFQDSEFDIVYLMQVFEHLSDPHAMMRELRRVLREGGEVYIAVPNGRSIWAKLFRVNWISGWFAPFHLFIYDIKSLTLLAKEHGFRVEKEWSRTPISWWLLNIASTRAGKRKAPVDPLVESRASRVAGLALAVVLRAIECAFKERDCLVVKLARI